MAMSCTRESSHLWFARSSWTARGCGRRESSNAITTPQQVQTSSPPSLMNLATWLQNAQRCTSSPPSMVSVLAAGSCTDAGAFLA
eukprot:CAMPEP_0196682918 /NCGR_PEP_ID=MMETSP1090-20130531/9545_1 /TAXON_ID=37098 /ORGANISM="Isochrysis sp, Strain CCMP1244" /LENGTH=84 /DNA_ID=CAMNT_0042021345 /DNA_START=160 /DNA_END=414 /DNA_ORIENTATION=-